MGRSYCAEPKHGARGKETCSGCDGCFDCQKLGATHVLNCWRCCGPMRVCTNCLPRVAEHIVAVGPPEGQWREIYGTQSYLRARRILKLDFGRSEAERHF